MTSETRTCCACGTTQQVTKLNIAKHFDGKFVREGLAICRDLDECARNMRDVNEAPRSRESTLTARPTWKDN